MAEPVASRPGALARAPFSSRAGLVLLLASVAVALFSWLLRYNDPIGGYGGLTDDHFFYMVRGWQMLFGELPDRDFVDLGAPLAYGLSALLQALVGRNLWSEFVFCVAVLSIGAGLTCVLAARASGSIVLGVLAALLQIVLLPRLYNYPKIIVYAVAVPVLWAWITSPTTRWTWVMAAVTAVAFLLRHDHGIYLVGAFGLVLLASRATPWRVRVRQGAVYALALALLLAPYFAYLQVNGGVVRHFGIGYRWAARDLGRAPLVLPSLEWQPYTTGEPSDAPPEEWWHHAPFPAVNGYRVWWTFWLEILLPVIALGVLAVRPRDAVSSWPDEGLKVALVAVLALVLDKGFLRGNLDARFADVSVPIVILAAWTPSAIARLVAKGRIQVASRPVRLIGPVRAVVAGVTAVGVLITALVQVPVAREQIANASLFDGVEAIRSDARGVTERLRSTWPLDAWAADDTRAAVQLAKYFEACTDPDDRVMVTAYEAPAIGLARRGFAGGVVSLRHGFFETDEEQRLVISRLQRQSVPVIVGPPASEMQEYATGLPMVADYFSRAYVNLGDRTLGDGLVVSLWVKRTASSVRTYEPLAFPCFR